MPHHPPEHLFDALGRLAQGWRRRSGVVGVGFGMRHRAGAWCEDDRCVVVTVRRKLGGLSSRQRFPERVLLDVNGVATELEVDVRETGGHETVQLQGWLGAAVDASGVPGSLSLFVRDGEDIVALVSGHVAGAVGTIVVLPWGARGTCRALSWGGDLDHATVTLPASPDADARSTQDDTEVRGAMRITSGIVGMELSVYSRVRGQVFGVRVRQRTGAYVPGPGNTARWMSGIVVTDRVTDPGDSGTLLYDPRTGIAVGTLLGADDSQSFFLPCLPALDRLGLTLP